MSKSIKLTNNNYWDSTGIIHDKTTLNEYLDTYTTTGTINNGAAYPYRKIFTIRLSRSYETVFLKFVAVEIENTGFIFNGEILIHLDVNKVCTVADFYGSYTARQDPNMKMVMYLESNDSDGATLSVYSYIPFDWRTIRLIILGAYGLQAINEDNSYSSSEPSYLLKKEI